MAGFRHGGRPANNHPRAFINSGDTAVEQLVHVLNRLRPHVVVTYGPDGGYGHPDHIRAHEITHAAIPRLPEEEQPQRIVWAVTSREDVDHGLAAIATIPEGMAVARGGGYRSCRALRLCSAP